MDDLIPPVNEKDHSKGNKNAPVILVEYGDFECPYCGEAYYIVQKILKEMGNNLRYVFRNFPLVEIHPRALSAAMAAEAAGLQGKFWEMHNKLFENQDNLEDVDLVQYAEDLELDIEQFTKDMDSQEVAQRIQHDLASGDQSGVDGTPTFFINAKKYENDSYDYEVLLEALKNNS